LLCLVSTLYIDVTNIISKLLQTCEVTGILHLIYCHKNLCKHLTKEYPPISISIHSRLEDDRFRGEKEGVLVEDKEEKKIKNLDLRDISVPAEGGTNPIVYQASL